MKLHELASAPGHDFKRQHMLKLMIDNGEQPEIVNASYARGHFSWGDLEKLGYAQRNKKHTAYGYEYWWTYTGPGSIAVITRASRGAEDSKQVLQSGQSTEPVQVDYSNMDRQ